MKKFIAIYDSPSYQVSKGMIIEGKIKGDKIVVAVETNVMHNDYVVRTIKVGQKFPVAYFETL